MQFPAGERLAIKREKGIQLARKKDAKKKESLGCAKFVLKILIQECEIQVRICRNIPLSGKTAKMN